MKYYSTTHQSIKVDFREALLRSEAADGGLYIPERLPLLPKAVINNLPWMSLKDIAYIVNSTLFDGDIPPHILKSISDDISTYAMPVYEIDDGIYVMELFHGPTKTVKDFGAISVTRIMRHLLSDTLSPLNVLVATTGHSGNAIASALHDTEGVNVFVLYPKGIAKHHVDHIITLGDNVHAIEVNGTIDDCVRIINSAFNDRELNESMLLTSANSMNVGSLLPSAIPYFHGYSQLKSKTDKFNDLYVSVPCGNCGTLLSGYISKLMGLPITRLIAACNENTSIHSYLHTGHYVRCERVKKTYAYGMDRAYSANVPRFERLSGGDINDLRRDIISDICTDSEIAYTINDVYRNTGYLLDPHSAVAYCAMRKNKPRNAVGLVMASAHPSLSSEALAAINDGSLKLPPTMIKKNYCSRPEAVIPPTYGALKKYLNYYMDTSSLSPRFA